MPKSTPRSTAKQATPPAESPPPPRKPRVPGANFPQLRPFYRSVTTFVPPWEPNQAVTIEMIVIPGGSGGKCTDALYDQSITADEYLELCEANWDVHESAGLTLFTRVIAPF